MAEGKHSSATLPTWDRNAPAQPATCAAASFLAPPVAPDEIGRLAQFRVLRLLGQGGMGMVFLAEDLALQRRVALKVMRPELGQGDDRAWQRFLREARCMASLKHDHLVTVYQAGQEGSVVWLAMELLEGETLADWIDRHPRPAPGVIVRLGQDIAQGLQAIHDAGLVHRDIKPGNLWVEAATGRVKILDFGLAREVEGDNLLTTTGAVVGTPAFLSPEQARGRSAQPRSDLFSLGGVLYCLCTGSLPFPADNTLDQLAALAADEPRPIESLNPGIPRALAALVMRLLAKNPDERPASAQEVGEKLRALRRGGSRAKKSGNTLATERLPAPSSMRRSKSPVRRARKPRWVLVAVLVAVTGLASLAAVGLVHLAAQPATEGSPSSAAENRPEAAGTVDLKDLVPETKVNWPFHRAKGKLGPKPPQVVFEVPRVGGLPAPRSLLMHPAPDFEEPASLTWRLPPGYRSFTVEATFNDSSEPKPETVVFSVFGDGRLLWRSNPLNPTGKGEECRVEVVGVSLLKLEVAAQGDVRGLHALWHEPRLIR